MTAQPMANFLPDNIGADSQPTARKTCIKHGEFDVKPIGRFTSGCPKCQAEFEERELRQAAETAERASAGRLALALQASEIPAKYRDALFDDALPDALRDWVTEAIKSAQEGPLVLVGGVGTGKTYASCAALLHIIRHAANATSVLNDGFFDIQRYDFGRFVTPSQFGRKLRDQWVLKAEAESALIQRYAFTPFLVLDDLGACRDLDTQLLQDLIVERHAAGLMGRTIITSNYGAAKFGEVVGERAADRIREGSFVVPIVGKSRRRHGDVTHSSRSDIEEEAIHPLIKNQRIKGRVRA